MRFRISHKGLEFKVKVFKTDQSLRAAYRRRGYTGKCKSARGLLGVVCPYTKHNCVGGKWVKSPEIGEILLSEESMAYSVLAHELLHAALQIARKTGNRMAKLGHTVSKAEEDVAYTHTYLMEEFVEKYKKSIPGSLGLWS